MIDRKILLESFDLVEENLCKRKEEIDLSGLLEKIKKHKSLLRTAEDLRHKMKVISEQIGQKIKQHGPKAAEVAQLKEATTALKKEIKTKEEELSKIELKTQSDLSRIPNLLHESVPIGNDEQDNAEVRVWGSDTRKMGKHADHLIIGKELGILDSDRAAKISGARFTVLRGLGAQLELALIQFMMDSHCVHANYTALIPPYLVHEESMYGTGQLPKFRDESFFLEKDGFFLVPTAEVPVTNLHANEIIPEEALPIRYAAFSPCFRREAGSYGQDTRGLIRQHQFHKVEMVKLVHPESSYEELEEMTGAAENILQKLNLPYRVVSLCSADIGFSAAKCYDIEVWLPGQQKYREISSCSNCTDFQARRINLKYRPKDGSKPRLLHTLNGSGLAVGRTLIALLENGYDKKEKSVLIPEALRPYFRDREKIPAEESL